MGQFDKFTLVVAKPKVNISILHLRNAVNREPSVVDSFYFRSNKNPNTTEKLQFVCDPIIELLNQTRIENTIGSDTLKVWLNQLGQTKNDPFADLRKQCSDDDLISIIKSRYIQAPCELLSWSKYMSENLDSFKKEVSLLRQKQAEESSKQVTGEQITEQTTSVNGVGGVK